MPDQIAIVCSNCTGEHWPTDEEGHIAIDEDVDISDVNEPM